MDLKWIRRFLLLTQHISKWSKDPSTKTGAVIITPNQRIVSLGYNGYPRGLADEGLQSRKIKYPRVIHAEMNAIFYARENLFGNYIFCSSPPCTNCAIGIIQTGIQRVYSIFPEEDFISRWEENIQQADSFFESANVSHESHILIK